MKKTVRRNTGQGWTTPKIVGTAVLPVAAVIGTYFLPLHLLGVAGEANAHREREMADFWEEWSLGLVVLGPTLLTTSFLAMASQSSKLRRVWVRIGTLVFFAGVYSQLWAVGTEIHISVMLGIIGVVYAVCADAFTPDSSGKATIDDEPTEDDESTETVAKHEKPVVAVPASLRPGSETAKVGIPLMPVVLLIVPVVAIVLDLRDLAVRNWRGASRKSR